MARKGSLRPERSAWSPELGEAFLALLRESGNARASARALGHPHLFNNRIQRDPDFRRACRAATAEVDARLRDAARPFLASVEARSMSPEDACDAHVAPRRRPTRREPVIRKTSNGRTQISYVRDGFWTSEVEADFLARLGATGNFDASARAVGFYPTSVYRRLGRWPAFAMACKEALDQAEVQLDYRLVAHAHCLLRKTAGLADDHGEEDETASFNPEAAMRIIAFLDRRKEGRTTRGRRKGPPERSFEEAVESILGKIEAIEKHEALMKARGEAGERG